MARGFEDHRPPDPVALDPITGIATFIAGGERFRSDPDVFVVAARSANLADFHQLGDVPPEEHHVHGSGAGLTYNDALGAAVGETVERYSFGIVHPEDLRLATYLELEQEGEFALGPEAWSLFHPSQKDSIPFSLFEKDTLVSWVKVEHLAEKRECYIPACIVYCPYFGLFPDRGENILAPAVSTGAACAFTPKEALLKGMCEVIERDAFITMWRNRLALPRVEIDVDSELYDLYQDVFVRPGLEFTLVQTTLDLGFPSFFGILVNRRHDPPRMMVGGACNPDPQKAALKTLLELTQGLQWMNHVGKSGIEAQEGYANIRSFDDRMHLYAFTDQYKNFNFIWNHSREIKLSQIETMDQGSHAANIQWGVQHLSQNDVNVLAIDLTPLDVAQCGLSVVKVMLPECSPMEGDHTLPFLGGERWRKVPVKLGLLDAPLALDQLNPYPHPYP